MFKAARTLLLCSFVLPSFACDSAEEKKREAAAAEARRKAELPIDAHEKNCEKGDADGCAALATAYQIGEDREYDEEKAQELFEKACNLGHGQSCMDGADGFLGSADDKALPLLKKGCELKNDDSCHRLEALERKLAKKAAEAPAAAPEGEAKPAEGEAAAPAEGEAAAPAEGEAKPTEAAK